MIKKLEAIQKPSKVVGIRKSDCHVVDLLESLLEEAKKGDLRSVCIVGDLGDAIISGDAGIKGNIFAIYGGLSNYTLDFRDRYIEK